MTGEPPARTDGIATLILPRPAPWQREILDHPAPNKVCVCGRRWRKTSSGLIIAVEGHGPQREHKGALAGSNIWWVTRSFSVAMSVWRALKSVLGPITINKSEIEKRIVVPHGGAITIKSADRSDSLIGDLRGIDGIIFDEAAVAPELTWSQALRPAMIDRKAWIVFLTTPRGHNWFKKVFDDAANREGWARWQRPTQDNTSLDPSYIASAKADMPSKLYQQDILAQFVLSGTARAYSEFEEELHVRPVPAWDGASMLDLCLALGVAPVAFLVTRGAGTAADPDAVVDEIATEDGTARAALAEFRRRYPSHRYGEQVRVFGSFAGDKRTSGPSDYEQVRVALPEAQLLVRARSGSRKDRTNALNSLFRSFAGEVKAQVAPHCERLLKDLLYTVNLEGSYVVDQSENKILGEVADAWAHKAAYLHPIIAAPEDRSGWQQRRPVLSPAAKRAHGLVYRAVQSGTLVRPEVCQQCGRAGRVEAAHEDYRRPLDVRWLCKPCHTSWDQRVPKGGVA